MRRAICSVASPRSGFFVMSIDPIQTPKWPAPNAEIEASIGRFIIAWNVLEREMDRAIEDLYDLDYDLAWSVTANLGTKSKLDIFQSGFHVLHEFFMDCDIESVNRLIRDTANASGEIRTLIVHGQPHHLLMKDETWDMWVKFRAKKGGVRGPMFRLHQSKFDQDTEAIKALIERWNQVRKSMVPGREFRAFTNKS
jgi:hypothetical protein